MPRPDGPPGGAGDVVPVFEELPIFEEQDLPPAEPEALARRLLDEGTPSGQQLHLLAARLLALGRDRRLRRLGVLSAQRGDGSSSVALGLTRALAEDDRRVLLVEMDLSHPAVDDTFSYAAPEVGLRRYLADDQLGLLTVRRPGRESFWVLSAGAAQQGAEAALGSPRLAPLLTAAERAFDYVVVDCPSLGAGGAVVQEQLDGIVLVIRERHTTREAVRKAAQLLKPEKLCGYVMNFSRRSPRG